MAWTDQTSGTSANLNDVFFVSDALTGIVAGEGGIILRTTNGGVSSPSPTPTATGYVYAHSHSHIYAYADRDSHGHCDGYCYFNSYGHGHTSGNAYADLNPDSECDHHAAAHSYPKIQAVTEAPADFCTPFVAAIEQLRAASSSGRIGKAAKAL